MIENCHVFAHGPAEAHAIHQQLRGDRALLQRLQFQGIQSGLGKFYELRRCPGCAATINAEISGEYALALISDHANLLARTLGQFERLSESGLVSSEPEMASNESRSPNYRSGLDNFLRHCGPGAVEIYGPYSPSKGRSRWRVQLCQRSSRTKWSTTVASREEAELLILQLRLEISRPVPLSCHQAIEQYLAYKATYVVAASAKSIGDRLRSFLPDLSLEEITNARAQDIYLADTRRNGRFGPVQAATHHARLRNAKEFFGWLVKKELVKNNPFASVDPVGRANAGKPQPTETDAQKLDAVLFEAASRGEEGALALLVQLYLGLRSSEVLKLQISAVEREGKKVTVVRRGKTRNASRPLELYADVAALLWPFCKNRPYTQRVFASHLPSCPAPNYLYKRMHHYCRLAGIQEYCPHSLRGLHSSLALVAGATTHHVAASLGHASFATTAKHYASPSAIENSRSQRLISAMKPERGALDQVVRAMESLSAGEMAKLRELLSDG